MIIVYGALIFWLISSLLYEKNYKNAGLAFILLLISGFLTYYAITSDSTLARFIYSWMTFGGAFDMGYR